MSLDMYISKTYNSRYCAFKVQKNSILLSCMGEYYSKSVCKRENFVNAVKKKVHYEENKGLNTMIEGS